MAQATILVRVADVPEAVAAMERARSKIERQDAAIRLFLEREHPDEGCRLACPGEICSAMRAALEDTA